MDVRNESFVKGRKISKADLTLGCEEQGKGSQMHYQQALENWSTAARNAPIRQGTRSVTATGMRMTHLFLSSPRYASHWCLEKALRNGRQARSTQLRMARIYESSLSILQPTASRRLSNMRWQHTLLKSLHPVHRPPLAHRHCGPGGPGGEP